MRRVGALVCLALFGCSAADAPSTSTSMSASTSAAPTVDSAASSTDGAAGGSARCIVRLHGKSGDGADTVIQDGVSIRSPRGNAAGWGGRQWLYFPATKYAEARAVVEESARGCEQVIIDGFSNGAGFAAKLYCRGETFGGRVVGVVIDDPVVDHGVDNCTPDPNVAVTLYWTGALAGSSAPGTACAGLDWTCDGDTLIGLDAYAAALKASVRKSPFTTHEQFVDAPELANWK